MLARGQTIWEIVSKTFGESFPTVRCSCSVLGVPKSGGHVRSVSVIPAGDITWVAQGSVVRVAEISNQDVIVAVCELMPVKSELPPNSFRFFNQNKRSFGSFFAGSSAYFRTETFLLSFWVLGFILKE